MNETEKLKRILASSAFTSLLLILDRVVVNFIPLLFWSVDEAAFWIFLRAWMFFLCCCEGGVGGYIANLISKSDKSQFFKIYKENSRNQIIWSSWVFLANLVLSGIYLVFSSNYNFQNLLLMVLAGLYASFYFQSQIVVYFNRGIGRISEGQNYSNKIRLAEIISLVILPVVGATPIESLIFVVLIRTIGVSIGSLSIGKHKRKDSIVKKESKIKGFKLHFDYFLYALYPALSNLIPIVIVSYYLSSIAVIAFSISRLLSRIVTQLSQILTRVLWPYLRNKKDSAESEKKIVRKFSVTLIATLPFTLATAYFLNGVEFKGIVMQFIPISLFFLQAYMTAFIDLKVATSLAKETHRVLVYTRTLSIIISAIALLFSKIEINVVSIVAMLIISEMIVILLIVFQGLKNGYKN